MLLWLEFLKDGYVHLIMFLMTMGLLSGMGGARPSGRLFLLLAVPIGLAVLSFFMPTIMTVIELYNVALFLAMLVDRFLLTVEPGHIEMRRTLSSKLSINQNNPVVLHLYNDSVRPVEGWVTDGIPEGFHWGDPIAGQLGEREGNAIVFPMVLSPRKRLHVEYHVKPKARGTFHFGEIYFRYKSRWGLLWILKKGGRSERVKVYPDLKRIQEMRIRFSKSRNVGELRRRVLGGEGTDFAGLRTYLPGDDMRRMDWQATARMDMPIVQTYSPEVDQPIMILLDAGRKMQGRVQGLSKFDWALNAALSFSAVAIERGDQVGIGVFHREMIEFSAMAGGRKHLNQLLENLHDIKPVSIEPIYEQIMAQSVRRLKHRSLVIIFTDLIDPLASRSLIRSLKAFSNDHLLMLVTLSDSEVRKIADSYPETSMAVYEKGVALDLINLREKALRELLKGFGVIVIDTEPEKMDEDLVNRYLAVKLKNRL